MQNLANTTPGTAEAGGKKSLKKRAVSELEKYAVISAYLWVPRALSIFFATADQRVQFRIFFRQPGLSSFQSALAFFLAAVMPRDLTLRVWTIGNELPPGGRRRNHGGKRRADDYR
jgi:hypothetical protein